MVLKGSQLATEILDGIKLKIEKFGEKLHIAIILVGDDEASKIFVNLKAKACEKIGVKASIFRFEKDMGEIELLKFLQTLNEDSGIHGILIQLPLPSQINEIKVLNHIAPEKDVDGLSPKNMGNLLLGSGDLVPCAVEAIMEILDEAKIELEGKNVVVISRSNLIGKPLALLLIKKSATVTVCHSKTKNLAEHTKAADIVITATGKPKFLKGEMIKEGAVIIDGGCERFEGNICGDADFESVSKKVSAITPVPGGVGPLTVAMVIKNLVKCYELQKKLQAREYDSNQEG